MKITLAILLLCAVPVLAQERALVDSATGAVLKTQRLKSTPAAPAKWLTVNRSARPVYDDNTQKLVRTNIIRSEAILLNWNVIELTQEEKDIVIEQKARATAAAADEAAREAKRVRVAAAIDTLRQWKLDAEEVTVTAGNAVAVLQTLSDRFGTLSENLADLLEAQRIDR